MFFKKKYIGIPENKILLETKHWIINHRLDTEYPGYLMLGSKESTFRVSDLCTESLRSMGIILGAVENRMYERLKPETVIISKLGFSKGFGCHFHLIPVYSWLYDSIKRDKSYSISEPDGLDFSLFISRKFCEGSEQFPKRALNIEDAITLLDLQSLTQNLEVRNA